MRTFTETERKKIFELWQTKQPINRIIELTGASRSTVYRIVKGYDVMGKATLFHENTLQNLKLR